MMQINEQGKIERREKILKREATIAKNFMKLEQWKNDLVTKREKKEADARAAKNRKDRLIDEVRRHFGYTVDPRDDRFKQLLELKEKQQRKAMKESKRQDKESKMLAKMASKGSTATPTDETAEEQPAEEEEEEEQEGDDEKKK